MSLSPLDPSAATRDLLRAVLPSFHVVTPDLRYRPSLLAAEPEVRSSGQRQEIVFRLRSARWSDGRPITVDDVAFTWKTMKAAGIQGFANLVTVAKESPTRGRLVLDPPYAAWRELFSAGRFVLPAHTSVPVEEWDTGPPVSGGPFSIGERVPGRSITLERNPRYWAKPQVEQIVVEFVPDPTTAIQLLAAGELDVVAPMLGVSWSRRLARVPGVKVTRAFGPHLVQLLPNAKRIGLDERRKLAGVVDRKRFTDVVLAGEGRLADGVLVPEQADAIPAWSGVGTSSTRLPRQERTLAYPRTEVFEVLARYLQAEAERSGGDLELVALDADVFRRTWLPKGRFDYALWETRSGPEPWLSRWFRTGSRENVTGGGDKTIDALLTVTDLGGGQGGDALGRLQQLLADQATTLPILQVRTAMGAKGVQGPRANPSVDGPLWNAEAWRLG